MNDITVKNISEIAPYTGPHAIDGIRFRAVREALGVSSWGMSVLELDPHCSGYPEHDHQKDRQEEVYLVLRGAIVIEAQGGELTLREGACARVPAEVSRKLLTRDEGATILALGGTPGEPYKPSFG